MVLCALLAVGARGAARPAGQDDALLGVPDAAAAQPEATGSRAALAGDAPAKPPAFRPPLPGRIARDGDVIYAVNDPSESGVFRHPAGLFEIRFPGAWRVMRHIGGGYVWYTFSTEAGRVPPKQVRVGAKVIAVVLSDVFRRQHLTAAAVLKHLMPGILRDEPGMKLHGQIGPAKLGALEAATCTLQGTWEDHTGEFTWEIFVAEREGVAYQLTCFAPADQYASLRPAFLKIAAESTFGRASLARREQSFEARQITQKFRASVVSIVGAGANGSGWTGSGFIISRDGYVLTNYHVAFDMATRQPAQKLMVQWDESLKRPPVEAQFVDAKFKMSAFEESNYGTDVALLKIPPGEYEPMPLSRLAEIEAGDDVVTLGFPSRGLLEGVSLTVSKGVVMRFNRGPQGDVDSIYVDAAFTHGSSGGPSVSLVTGGVIGLNTFGQDVVLDPQAARRNDLIRYRGVVPIDAAIREFPLACIPGLGKSGRDFDFLDCFELSKYFVSVGSLKAAEQVALRAVNLEPQQAIARMRLGECHFQRALAASAEGDPAAAQAQMAAARKAYGEALARDARRPDTLVAFAQLELQENHLQEASDLATRATAADPKDWQGHLLLADICLRQSRFDEALQHVEKAKVVTGGLIVNPHVTAATIYAAKRDFENARKEWAEAARISPVYLPARLGVAAYFEQVKRPDDAVAEYKRILNDFPDNGEVLGRIGLCLNGAGRAAEAANYFSQSVRRCAAANQPPDESVLMYFGDFLLQQPDGPGGAPPAAQIFALYLFHHPRGQWTGLAHLRLAGLHAKHGAAGLASAHARLATRSGGTAEITREAQGYPTALLSLGEIQAMASVLQYPVAVAVDVVTSSPLGFTLQGNEQIQQLQQAGMPNEILRAIVDSLNRQPAVVTPPGPGGGTVPPAPGGFPVTPPEGGIPGFSPPMTTGGPDLRGTWVATGMTDPQTLFRSVIIFGDMNLFSSDTWVGMQSLGRMSGTYRFEGGRLILQPDGGQPFAPNFQLEGNTIVMDVVNFAPGVRFTRQQNTGFPQ